MAHIATINAFKNKFGTYTGAVLDKVTGDVVRERFNNYDDARNFVKAKAWELFGPINYAAVSRKGEYYANVWSA